MRITSFLNFFVCNNGLYITIMSSVEQIPVQKVGYCSFEDFNSVCFNKQLFYGYKGKGQVVTMP